MSHTRAEAVSPPASHRLLQEVAVPSELDPRRGSVPSANASLFSQLLGFDSCSTEKPHVCVFG